MIPGKVYTYRFSANIRHTCSSDIVCGNECYENDGLFVGMTPETNFCIFVGEFGHNFRVHYVLAEQVGREVAEGDESTYRAMKMFAMSNSPKYIEPLGCGDYTPVLFVEYVDLCVKVVRESSGVEQKHNRYCDMV